MINFDQVLKDVENQYNRVIIVNEDDSKEYKQFLNGSGVSIINLSAKLSELISGLSDEEKQMEAWDILKSYIDGLAEDIVAFDNIDYMFSPEVGVLDPIVNFNYYSRKKKIIILFIHAKKRGNVLFYSEEGTKDYCEMDASQNEGFLFGW